MLNLYVSNIPDICGYVAKLSKQQFNVWMRSNPGDNIFFEGNSNEVRISEWNIYIYIYSNWDILKQQYIPSPRTVDVVAALSRTLGPHNVQLCLNSLPECFSYLHILHNLFWHIYLHGHVHPKNLRVIAPPFFLIFVCIDDRAL